MSTESPPLDPPGAAPAPRPVASAPMYAQPPVGPSGNTEGLISWSKVATTAMGAILMTVIGGALAFYHNTSITVALLQAQMDRIEEKVTEIHEEIKTLHPPEKGRP